MKTLHAKSPCCRGRINHFGKRRRQCQVCKKTWRIRLKRRGRKQKRASSRLISRTFLEYRTLVQQKRKGGISQSGLSRRLAKALNNIASAKYQLRLPSGQCALLGDGLYFKFNRVDWVMYIMAIKPASSSKAYYLDPVLLKGRECYERWKQAIATISLAMKKRIQTFVSDGFRGSQSLSEQNHWLHQRCQFHLLAALVRGKGKRQYRIRNSRARDQILAATKIILSSKNNRSLGQARRRIRILIGHPDCPTYIRKQALEFLEREKDFRIYLDYPDLHLPTTTNSIESTGKLMRNATGTARTPQSVLLRAKVFLRLRKYIVCNGKSSTKLCQ